MWEVLGVWRKDLLGGYVCACSMGGEEMGVRRGEGGMSEQPLLFGLGEKAM